MGWMTRFHFLSGNIFLFSHIHTCCEDYQASYAMSTRDTFLRVKFPEHKANHLAPSEAKAKMHGALPPHPLYAFMVWCLDTGVNLSVPFIYIVIIFRRRLYWYSVLFCFH
jgi:hypothetical protein